MSGYAATAAALEVCAGLDGGPLDAVGRTITFTADSSCAACRWTEAAGRYDVVGLARPAPLSPERRAAQATRVTPDTSIAEGCDSLIDAIAGKRVGSARSERIAVYLSDGARSRDELIRLVFEVECVPPNVVRARCVFASKVRGVDVQFREFDDAGDVVRTRAPEPAPIECPAMPDDLAVAASRAPNWIAGTYVHVMDPRARCILSITGNGTYQLSIAACVGAVPVEQGTYDMDGWALRLRPDPEGDDAARQTDAYFVENGNFIVERTERGTPLVYVRTLNDEF